jgi:hypothetical protein
MAMDTLSDNLITEMRLRLAGLDFDKVSKENARDAMFYVCENSAFDSAQRWLMAQEWDGKPRIEKFFSGVSGARVTRITLPPSVATHGQHSPGASWSLASRLIWFPLSAYRVPANPLACA